MAVELAPRPAAFGKRRLDAQDLAARQGLVDGRHLDLKQRRDLVAPPAPDDRRQHACPQIVPISLPRLPSHPPSSPLKMKDQESLFAAVMNPKNDSGQPETALEQQDDHYDSQSSVEHLTRWAGIMPRNAVSTSVGLVATTAVRVMRSTKSLTAQLILMRVIDHCGHGGVPVTPHFFCSFAS